MSCHCKVVFFAKYHWRTVKVQSSGKKHDTYSFLLFSWDDIKNAKDPEEARLWQHQRLPAEQVSWINNSTGAPGPFGCWWGGAGWLESPLHCVLLCWIYSTRKTEDYAPITCVLPPSPFHPKCSSQYDCCCWVTNGGQFAKTTHPTSGCNCSLSVFASCPVRSWEQIHHVAMAGGAGS